MVVAVNPSSAGKLPGIWFVPALMLALSSCVEQGAGPADAPAADSELAAAPVQAEPAPDPVAVVEEQYTAEAEIADADIDDEGKDSELVRQVRRFEPLDHFEPERGSSVIEFALNTSHAAGTAMYERPAALATSVQGVRTRCSLYEDAVVAQHEFLENGGPELDVNRLDPDGDGFVCGWNPVPYRRWLK